MAQSHIARQDWPHTKARKFAARFGCVFPLTPALSLGERVNAALRGEQSRPVGLALRDARCSLSLPPSRRSGALARREGGRERVRVRGELLSRTREVEHIPGTPHY